ncbi:hypothetical protein [Paractinoplanes atraurantiacus]|uniref:Uncharacterized protein n=1 Tax=Paractinoplanes atraurantiacus TaxID=1036182 RepID=A0A285J5V6_9ACTN|nr:hypothetical protein [Actinoplanes atraurantiacus]SNY55257.1 hypothetical protein SAMN05421748_11692 [Actinoplanes atraurantiacus]
MSDTDIRQALARATDHLEAPPDLLGRVRSGGRRRVVRRRTLLAGGLAAGAAGLAFATRLQRAPAITTATRGDLAGDLALLERVRKAWREMAGPGEARIHWAGSTPAGPVALVAQRIQPAFDALGFVDSDGDELRTTGSTFHVPYGTVPPGAMLAGPGRDVLVVATAGRSIEFSPDYRFDGHGQVRRSFAPLTADADGMAIRRFEAADGVVRIALRQQAEDPSVPLANLHDVVDTSVADNQIPELIERDMPGWKTTGEGWEVLNLPRYADPSGYHAWTGPTQWRLRAVTPDGRRLVVQTLAMDGTARVFWMHGKATETPTPHYLGLLEEGLATETPEGLSILHARLPQRLGVAVAALDCGMRYRARGGAWQSVTGPAELLPDAATELEVTPSRGQRVVMPLP